MSKDNRGIAEHLFGRIRRELLSLFLLNSGRSFYLLELVDILRTGRGGVQRELANLTAAGIVTKERAGVRTNFRVDPECRGYDELMALVLASRELDPLLLDALESECPDAAAVRSGDARPRVDTLDMELVVLGDVDADLLRAELDRVELFTGIRIRETVVPAGSPLPTASSSWNWDDPEHGTLLMGRRSAFRREAPSEPEHRSEPDLFSSLGADW